MTHKNSEMWNDGAWLAHRYDASADAFHLRHVSRSAHNNATFLTDEYLGVEPSPMVLSRREATTGRTNDASLHFILHSAFCAYHVRQRI